MNILSIVAFTTVFSLQTVHPKTTITTKNTCCPFLYTQVKWTWQLPQAVRTSFNKSRYTSWYIERMIRYDSGNKMVYRFYLNNGNLLDGDHHDCFQQFVSLDIADNGTLLGN